MFRVLIRRPAELPRQFAPGSKGRDRVEQVSRIGDGPLRSEQVLLGQSPDHIPFDGLSEADGPPPPISSTWTVWLAIDCPRRVEAMIHIGTPAWILDTSAPLPMRLLSVPGVGRLMMRLLSVPGVGRLRPRDTTSTTPSASIR